MFPSAACRGFCYLFCLRLQLPLELRVQGKALLLAGPEACTEVHRKRTLFARLYAPAEFQHAARALHGRAWRGEALVGCPCLAVEFVLEGRTGIELLPGVQPQ